MADADAPLALRRPRRAAAVKSEPDPSPPPEPAPNKAPKTPRRRHKAVRFSDPGPSLANGAPAKLSSASTGLTPSVRRASLGGTPRRQTGRSATPAASRAPMPTLSYAYRPQPAAAAQAAQAPLHHTVDGRVERRIRRGNLRDLLHKLEQQRRRGERLAQSEINLLRAEVKARDREIYELQNATVVIDTERIWGLEQQVEALQDELHRYEAAIATPTARARSHSYDWAAMTARDSPSDDELTNGRPCMYDDDDDDDDYAHHFGDATMAHLVASTPSRARSSFPTPPATSPNPPSTPCSKKRAASLRTPTSLSRAGTQAGVQTSLVDPAKERLEEELASLNLEVSKLTATLDSYRGLHARLSERLTSVVGAAPADSPGGSPLESLEHRVSLLVQAVWDRTATLAQLNASINDLGFPGADAPEMMVALASGFRAARLELEYLSPGELELPLTSHGAEVLDLLLTRLRALAKRAHEDEACIDEYHEIELSLRKQLDARVSAMDTLRADMAKAGRLMEEKRLRIQELELGNERLRGAVDGYARDMSELERLVERMDHESKDAEAAHAAALEERVAEAARLTAALRDELSEAHAEATRRIAALNKQHGAALALRDARVLELRAEVDRVNEALRAAHETARELRADRGRLDGRLDEDRARARGVVDAIKGELQRALRMSHDFLAGDEAAAAAPAAQQGALFAGGLARRASKGPGPKQRHDSGMGLLHTDEVSG